MATYSSSKMLVDPVFEFESTFDFQRTQNIVSRWWWLTSAITVLYVVAVFLGRHWMKDRSTFGLRGPLFLWNFALALFSLCGFLRTAPELWHSVNHFGFRHSVCDTGNFETTPSALWTWLFVASKIMELGDTVFIVLRKQPLIFLHWYHHATVLVYCFYSYSSVASTARWFIVMNYGVHAFMYSYYAVKALSIRIPRMLSSIITLTQLAQMVVGCFVNYSANQYKMVDRTCAVSQWNIGVSFLMYASYFILFARFFVDAYVIGKNRTSRSQADKLVKVN